jgi:hypothetical protein
VGADPIGVYTPEQIVYVQNNTGSDCDEFDVMGIDDMAITPTQNEAHFKWKRPVISGVIPSTADSTGKFVIAFEAIPDGEIGRAFIGGVCPAYIHMQAAGDAFADVADGETSYLQSGSSGAAQILWVESGTGNKWALVRLSGGGVLPVGQYQYSTYQMVSQNQAGFDFVRAHPLIG